MNIKEKYYLTKVAGLGGTLERFFKNKGIASSPEESFVAPLLGLVGGAGLGAGIGAFTDQGALRGAGIGATTGLGAGAGYAGGQFAGAASMAPTLKKHTAESQLQYIALLAQLAARDPETTSVEDVMRDMSRIPTTTRSTESIGKQLGSCLLYTSPSPRD